MKIELDIPDIDKIDVLILLAGSPTWCIITGQHPHEDIVYFKTKDGKRTGSTPSGYILGTPINLYGRIMKESISIYIKNNNA